MYVLTVYVHALYYYACNCHYYKVCEHVHYDLHNNSYFKLGNALTIYTNVLVTLIH